MLSLYEILKASKTGIASDMWTALAGANFGGAGSGAETKEITGIPPLSIRSNGTMLLDYLISGNMSQSGTPTPTTPIQPSECGDLETEGAHAGQYKIPISSANTTTPVYLGEVESTRKIKKLVFDGTESWQLFSDNTGAYGTWQFYVNDITNGLPTSSVCSNIAGYGVTATTRQNYLYGAYLVTSGTGVAFQMAGAKDTFTNITAWKSYLAAQYANGTPVCVWYVLATPTTAIVNEPLRKIGDYADTLSMEQAGVQIPTNRGNTVIDVETTLKPSQMYIKYQE